MSLVPRALGIGLGVILLVFHGCAIYVSAKYPKIKKTKFLQLALMLSVSDFLFGMELIYILLLKIIDDDTHVYGVQCMLILHIVGGTTIFSLAQTLIICLERLNATFPTQVRVLDILTSNISVGLCFGISHCLAIIRFVVDILHTVEHPCSIEYTMSPIILFTHDILGTLLVFIIMICYGIVMKRIIKQSKMATPIEHPQDTQNRKIQRMKRNVITLGFIIVVAIFSTLPRCLIGFYVHAVGGSGKLVFIMSIANNVFMTINPLVDPVIYILRIRQYREKLQCKCCKQNKVVSLTRTNSIGPLSRAITVEPFSRTVTTELPKRNTIELQTRTNAVKLLARRNTVELPGRVQSTSFRNE